jgi:hypothetical protein
MIVAWVVNIQYGLFICLLCSTHQLKVESSYQINKDILDIQIFVFYFFTLSSLRKGRKLFFKFSLSLQPSKNQIFLFSSYNTFGESLILMLRLCSSIYSWFKCYLCIIVTIMFIYFVNLSFMTVVESY